MHKFSNKCLIVERESGELKKVHVSLRLLYFWCVFRPFCDG